jgi:hypothetical protein
VTVIYDKVTKTLAGLYLGGDKLVAGYLQRMKVLSLENGEGSPEIHPAIMLENIR